MLKNVVLWSILLSFGLFGCDSADSGSKDTVSPTDSVSPDTHDMADPGPVDAKETADGPDVTTDQTGPDLADPSDTTLPQDLTQPQDTTSPTIPFECNSPMITEGWNNGWNVAGKSRSFYIDLPTNLGTKPLGVIFVYHGFGDSVDNFKAFFKPNPDANPDFPFVVVYPKSMALNPTGGGDGIEWSVFNSQPGDQNPDAAFFEEILGCIANTTQVDSKSIFAFGFSAGAIFTNMLHARYPSILPTVISMSGAWFNDSSTVAKVNTMGMATLDWADLTGEPGTVLMTHGGAKDVYGMMGITIIDFELSASYAIDFLTSNGQTVIDCPHTYGHTNHPQFNTGAMINYFTDHRVAGPSPYVADGLPAWFPAGCTLHPAK